MAPSDVEAFLRPTPTIESEHPEIVAYTERSAVGATGDVETAVRLYYAVRDDIRYDPYSAQVSVDGLKATATLAAGRGWCVAKAIVLAACCRALGIPARLGFADVRNHLATARMRERLNTDVFYWHGYTSLLLEGRWVKATPAFNVELCEKLNLLPLEFDGRSDSIYHPFDRDGHKHMEYLHHRGEYADVPIDAILATFREHYAGLQELIEDSQFDREVEEQARRR